MTCIVSLVQDGIIYMGGDSAGVSGLDVAVRKDPKIYKVGEFIFGYTTSFRMGQLLGYKFSPPVHYESDSIEKYMHTFFIDHIRELFKENGYSQISNNTETGGCFLVGYKGRVFNVQSDYQIAERIVNFDAVGSGSDIALGSLYSSDHLEPKDRLMLALEAAEEFNGGVRGPFLIETHN